MSDSGFCRRIWIMINVDEVMEYVPTTLDYISHLFVLCHIFV